MIVHTQDVPPAEMKQRCTVLRFARELECCHGWNAGSTVFTYAVIRTYTYWHTVITGSFYMRIEYVRVYLRV